MKNKYSPISDSDDSSKTLNDEKADSQSFPSDGTPPPYSASNKFIDLEMADGSAQNSANNSGWDVVLCQKVLAGILLPITIGYIVAYAILLVLFFGFKASVNAKTLWGLFGGFVAAFVLFLLAIFQMPKEWFQQAKQGLTQAGRATKNVLSAMCISVLCVCFLDVLGFTAYYAAKKFTGFEKINNNFFYAVCFVNFVLFLYLTMNANARERLRLVVVDMGNGIKGLGNGINGLGNAVDHMFGTNRGEQVSQNEGIELQPLAAQSAEV
ncbi:wtf meiotic driver [Schizosaccharomyces osmophilus]|uniref:Wtf meiotic driver n=1 Tax=Schizosaccharomyces osmophilus TaxID=2545709 RepID=A0AAF0AU81_9SCHI|nr:wtf meiotic driver [Schizosaccharomyces osmophilus]WBW71342.1 wtf meiotic driver [Schizosaccharomyces osmophilus]